MAEEKGKPEYREIATTGVGRDITRGFLDALLLQPQDADSVLRARGGDPRIYQEVMRDDQVKSTFQQRRLAVVSREWFVEAGGESAADKAAAAFIKDMIDTIAFDRITDKMLYGVFWGWAVGECMWKRDGRFVTLDDVKVRKARRFRWDRDGNLRLLTITEPSGEIMPPRKFWTFSTGSDNDDDPYGLGLAHWLYWPVFFKRNDLKFWLIFLDKFGGPTAHGKYQPGATDDERKKLLEALAAIQQDAGIITPDGMTIELLEAARSGTATYENLYGKMDSAISKVVLSQTMTTDDGSSRAQADVHMDVRQEVVKADSDLVMGTFNSGPVTWLTEWNFPGAAPPRVWRRVEGDPDLAPVAERDKNIYELGYKPTPEYIEETYGPGWVPREAGEDGARPPPPAQTELAESAADTDSDDSIDELITQLIEGDGWEPLMEEVLAPARAAIENAATPEEARVALAEAIGQMNPDRIVDVLAKAGFASRLAGETGADTQ